MDRKGLDAYWCKPTALDETSFWYSEGYSLSECVDDIRLKVQREEITRFCYGGNMYDIEFFEGLIIVRGITSGFGTSVIDINSPK